LHQSGHDPRRFVVEVYDDSQPASRVEVAAVEVLASRGAVIDTVVGTGDHAEDEIDLVHQLGTSQGQMKASPGVEYDETTLGISDAGVICGHD
jgi:hypothetical protein